MTDPIEVVLAYHEQTKHRPGRYAAGPGSLDWATQPDPFRRYEGAASTPLPLPPPTDEPRWDAVLARESTAAPLGPAALAQLLFDSLALSAWKVAGGSRWALRVNPSSGNLHPTEGYLICGGDSGLQGSPAVFHYAPRDHALELRRRLAEQDAAALLAALEPGSFFVALTSIHWREAWKYGERAFRYCQLDVGHAVAQLSLAASALGWHLRACESVDDGALAALLGIQDQRGPEAEHPDCLLLVAPSREGAARAAALRLPAACLERLGQMPAEGTRNVLSAAHRPWPILDEVSAAARRPAAPDPSSSATWTAPSPPLPPPRAGPSARRLFHQRRSAVAMDGRSGLPAASFFAMLQRLSTRGPPFDALQGPPLLDLALFVHRVEGLEPGLYLLLREAARQERLRAACSPGFSWERPAGCPETLDLFLLAAGDAREAAQLLSCGQEIAADGAFAIGMLADFDGPLRARGPWLYRRLHWEAGALGQLLYLEAEAAGLRGTGIGCFLDDLLHELLGLSGRAFQDLYHFTIGGPVEDGRISTEPAYPERRQQPTGNAP